MTGGKIKRIFVKQIFHLLLRECFFLGEGRMQVVAHFWSKTLFIEWIPDLEERLPSWAFWKGKGHVNSNHVTFAPCCDIQRFLLPPPLHMSAAVLGLCLLAVSERYKSFLLGLYTETTYVGAGQWLLYSCIEQTQNYLAFHLCLPVHKSL